MLTKPEPKSTSCSMYLLPVDQIMDANVPEFTEPCPMLMLYRPNWLVLVAWVSLYTVVPVAPPSWMVRRPCMLVLFIGVPDVLRATPWYLMACGACANRPSAASM